MPGFPRDPLISRYPAEMSAGEARFEIRRAKQLRRRVPLGHPYGVAPTWTPYPLARLIARVVRLVAAEPPVSERHPRRRDSAHRSPSRSR